MPFLLSFLFGDILFFSARLFPVSSMVFFLAVVVWLMRNKKTILVLVVALSFLFALLRTTAAEKRTPFFDRSLEVQGTFLDHDRSAAADSQTWPFLVEKAIDDETGQELGDLEGTKIWVRSDDEVDPDDTYDLHIRTGKDTRRLNPGSMDRGPVYASVVTVKGHEEQRRFFSGIFDPYRQSLKSYIERRFSRDTADFIAAVTIGEVQLDDKLRDAFNTTGLAHILSISGTHFGLFSVVLFGCLVFLVKRLPYSLLQRVTLYMSPSQVAAIICVPLMLLYLGISGGSLPAVRSCIMISLFLAGLLLGRKGFWLQTILLAACSFVLWDPAVVFSLSFQLSFIAVVFIGFAVERRDDAEGEREKNSKASAFLRSSLRLTLAATIGTAPLVAYYFHYLSLISPLANLLIAPLVGFVVIPLALISSFSYVLTGGYLFAPFVSAATEISLRLVRLMAGIPYADIAVPAFPLVLIFSFYAAFLIYLASRRKRTLLIVPFLPFLGYLLFSLASPAGLRVTFLDVGQGDSALVELPDGKTMVIDTGRSGHETAGLLSLAGKRRIDALTLTHSHPDHAGGLAYILKRYPVGAIWDNGRIAYPEGIALPRVHRALGRGDVIEKGQYMIQVFHPYEGFSAIESDEYEQDNNGSLVLRISGKRHAFFFAGDVEEEAEDDLAQLGTWLRSDVLKVPHHGGRTSVHEGLLSAISPSIAVISAGRNNAFGHPSLEMLQALSGIKIFRTDQHGAVKMVETDDGLSVKTYADLALEKADTVTGEVNNIKRLFMSW
jgi:competence protein ComEC